MTDLTMGEHDDGHDDDVERDPALRMPPRKGAGYYAVDTGDGSELCSGLPPELARQAAQNHANRLNESVWLYEIGGGKAEEIEPE